MYSEFSGVHPDINVSIKNDYVITTEVFIHNLNISFLSFFIVFNELSFCNLYRQEAFTAIPCGALSTDETQSCHTANRLHTNANIKYVLNIFLPEFGQYIKYFNILI